MCDRSLDVVHGLPDQCRLTEVEELFGTFGKVDYVFLPPAGNLRRHEPGFVKFCYSDGAAAAFKASQSGVVHLHNQRLHCEYHRNKSAAPMGGCGGSTSSTRPLDPPPPAPNANRSSHTAWQQPMQPVAEVEEFIRMHSLGSRAEAELRSLPIESQLGLTRKRYTPDIRSMDGMVIKLCRQARGEDATRPPFRSNTRGKGSQGPRRKPGTKQGSRYQKEEHLKRLEQFIQINHLDESCAQAFREAAPEIQAAVLEDFPDLQIKPTNDGRPLNPSAVAIFKLTKAKERIKTQGIRLKESSREASPWRQRQQHGSSEDDRSRSRSWRSRSADSYSARSQQMQEGDGDRPAPEGDIVGADPQGERGRRPRRSESGSRSRSDSRSGEKGQEGTRRVVVTQGEDKDDGNASSLLEVSNLPDLSSKGKNATKYLCDLFNPTLKTLPDFNKELGGEPVQRAWEVPGKAGMIFMQLQNTVLAESACRTLHGLEFAGSTIKVQGVPKAEADGLLLTAP